MDASQLLFLLVTVLKVFIAAYRFSKVIVFLPYVMQICSFLLMTADKFQGISLFVFLYIQILNMLVEANFWNSTVAVFSLSLLQYFIGLVV